AETVPAIDAIGTLFAIATISAGDHADIDSGTAGEGQNQMAVLALHGAREANAVLAVNTISAGRAVLSVRTRGAILAILALRTGRAVVAVGSVSPILAGSGRIGVKVISHCRGDLFGRDRLSVLTVPARSAVRPGRAIRAIFSVNSVPPIL